MAELRTGLQLLFLKILWIQNNNQALNGFLKCLLWNQITWLFQERLATPAVLSIFAIHMAVIFQVQNPTRTYLRLKNESCMKGIRTPPPKKNKKKTKTKQTNKQTNKQKQQNKTKHPPPKKKKKKKTNNNNSTHTSCPPPPFATYSLMSSYQ